MKDFYYLVSFYEDHPVYQLKINLQYENYLVPVFNHQFHHDEFELIYNQISEYFNHTNIKTTKKDLILFYNAFKGHDLVLPEPLKIDFLDESVYFSKDLSPKEILFLIYIDTKSVDGKIAKYWTDQYHIDIDYTIQKLLNSYYLTTKNYLFNLEKQTKENLLILLKEKEVTVQGNKPKVVQAVKDNFSNEELKVLFSGLNYKLTTRGEQIAFGNENLNDFHKSYYRYANHLKIEEFYILAKRFNNLEAKEVIKMMVKKKDNEEISDFDWDKFFDEEVKDNKEINNFAEVIKKYAKPEENEAPINQVSDEDFFEVIYKKKDEEKLDVKEEPKEQENEFSFLDEEFYKILNKKKEEEKNNQKQIKTKEDEIELMSESFGKNKKTKNNKKQSEVNEEEEIESIIQLFGKNKVTKNNKKQPEIKEEEMELMVQSSGEYKEQTEIKEEEIESMIQLFDKNKEIKNNQYKSISKSKLRRRFIRCFLYSSIVSLVIIYSLYYYVFK